MTESASAVVSFFLRHLREDDEDSGLDYPVDGSNPGSGSGMILPSDEEESTTNERLVFLIVNAFLLFVLLSVCSWLCCCNGLTILTTLDDNRRASDAVFAQAVLERRQARERARHMTPEQRKAKILQSFQRNQVCMIVKETDLVQEDPLSPEKSLQHQIQDETDEPRAAAIYVEMGDGDDSRKPDAATQQATPPLPPLLEKRDEFEDPQQQQQHQQSDDEADQKMGSEQPVSVRIDDLDSNEAVTAVDVELGETQPSAAEVAAAEVAAAVAAAAEQQDDVLEQLDESFNSDLQAGFLILRHPSRETSNNTTTANNDPNQILRVPNCCAICLGSYEVGDEVVWSSNFDVCRHAFHKDCLLDWLVHSSEDQDGTPCPCCRQSFTDLKTFRRERIIRWEAGNAFNPRAVRFSRSSSSV